MILGLKLLLLALAIFGFVGFLVCWIQAYHRVPNIDRWGQQFGALSPWWFLDRQLLAEQDKGIQRRAGVFFLCYAVPIILWFMY